MNRIEDIVSAVKLEELKNMVKVGDLLQKKEEEEKKKCICKWGACSDRSSYSRSGCFCCV